MRVLYLTAGTGGFFCGACIRDNALTHALRGMGHEVHLMPLYLPMTLDQSDASDCPLFLGGVNVWLQDKVSLFRHTPRFIDKLFDSKPFLKIAGQRSGMTDAKVLGHMTVNSLKGLAGTQKKEIRRMQKWLRANLEVDVICLSNLLLLGLAPALREVFPVPVVVTMQSEESFLDALPAPYGDEAWALLQDACKDVRGFIGISHFHARLMEQRLHLDRDRVRVVYNGIDLNGFTTTESAPSHPEIGYVSRMHPSKGLHTLIDAFIQLSDNIPEARLRLVGSLTDSEELYVKEQREKLSQAGLEGRVSWHFNVTHEEKIQHIQKMSLVSVPTTYAEGFGLYVVESLACAVPLVLPERGSFTELIGDTEGGHLYHVESGEHEVDVLCQTLKDVLADLPALHDLGAQGRAAVVNRYDVGSMADGITEALSAFLEHS